MILDDSKIKGNVEIHGDLLVEGDLKVTGDLIVNGTLITVDSEVEVVEKKILKCKKCGGAKFYPTGMGVSYSIYIENGTPPGQNEYKCENCGDIE